MPHPALPPIALATARLLFGAALLGGPVAAADRSRPAGDSASYAVSRWEMKDGLPLNKVRAVAQTPDGYLWIGTFNGLARFDGVRFKVYDIGNTPQLHNNGIESLCVDASGQLWIGDNSGHVAVLAEGRFHSIELPAQWPRKPVLRLVADPAGTVWAMSEEGALMALRDRAVHTLISARANPSLFAVDSAGNAWIGLAGQLHQVDAATGLAVSPTLRLDGRPQAIFPARAGGIWILNGGWLRRWERGSWVEDRGRANWGTIVLAAFIETRAGRILGGSFKEGVRILNPDGTVESLDEGNGLAHNWAYCVFEDREGTVWVGTGNGGLHGLNPRRIMMVDAPDHWRSSAVLSVTPARSGGLWVGTEGGGVYRMQDGRITNLPNREGMWQAVANSVLEDRTGRLWVGTWSSALRYLEQGEFKAAYHESDGRNVVPTVFESRTGDIWVGTRDGPGRRRDGVWEWFDHRPELRRAVIRCFAEEPDGTLWCGSDGAGVFRIRDAEVSQFRSTRGLVGDHVRSILVDDDGAVWIGTRSGLARYKEGRFASITVRQGLPSDVICQILDDGAGHLWMGSLGGVFRAAKTQLNRCAEGEIATVQCLVCDHSGGLATLEMSEQGQPSGCRTPDGRLWFATGKGLAMVNPAHVRANPLPPPVHIEELLVDGVRLPLSGTETSARQAFQIAPGGRQFEVRYTGLSLTNPGRVGFRYRLEGLHDDWIDAGARRAAFYTQLAPGRYTFRVTARNADGVWNEAGAAVALRVLPHFWQTWWFQAGAWMGSSLAVGLGLLGLARQRTRHRLAALERQRALERERGRIARDIHDDLGSNLTRIVMLSESARAAVNQKMDTSADLGEICQIGRDLTLQLGEIVWAVNPEHDTLDSFASYVGSYARDFLGRSSVRCRLDVPVDLPARPLDSPTRHNLFLAFKEALNNAVRHSGAGSVFVTLRLKEEGFLLGVRDDGRGFTVNGRGAGGNGLANMARRLGEVGGHCEISSASGEGTTVTFVVPLPRSTRE